MITPLPSSGKTPLKPGYPQLPFFGVDPVLTEEADGVRPFPLFLETPFVTHVTGFSLRVKS